MSGLTPQEFRRGQAPGAWDADRMQRISDAARMVHGFTAEYPLIIHKDPYGMRLRLEERPVAFPVVEAPSEQAPAVTQFAWAKLTVDGYWKIDGRYYGDTVIGRLWDGTDYIGDEDEEFHIAKPYDVRKSPFHGQAHGLYSYDYKLDLAIQRDSIRLSQTSDREAQEVTPPYYLGQVIQIMKTNTLIEGVEWLELTSRHWAKRLDPTP